MPKFGKYIKGDYTNLRINGEVTELFYKGELIASADPYYIVFYKSPISTATVISRYKEFCKELEIELTIRQRYEGVRINGRPLPVKIKRPLPDLDRS